MRVLSENTVLKKIIAFVLTFAAVISVFAFSITDTAKAVTQAEIDALEEEREALLNEQADLQSKIDELENKQATALEKRNALSAKMEATQKSIENLTAQIENYEVLIVEKEEEVKEKEKEETEKWVEYEDYVRMLEENGTISFFSVIFGATSFSDLLSRIDFVSEIMSYEEELYLAVVEAKEATIKAKEDLKTAKAEMEENKEALIASKEDLQEETDEASHLLSEIEGDLSQYDEYFKKNAEEEAAITKEIEAKMALLESQNGGSTGGYQGPGSASGFIWPSYTTWVTSEFGWRIHPIYGDRRHHNGIDIGANWGSEIWSAAEGTVITSVYSESYGNYVVVYHGNNTATLYAHMDSRAVSEGDYVSQGQVLGYVGNTGNSKGAHIHYEVQVGGTPVVPMSYY